jgi:hypothetical protein
VNQVRVQDAVFQQAVLNYQNTVLLAQQEVEDGLSAFSTSQEALTRLNRAAAAAARTTGLSLLQYKAGETSYTTVITSEQSQLTIDDSVASTKGNVALGLVAVYRALGGGWELRGDRDVVSDEVKAEMARRTNWGDILETAECRRCRRWRSHELEKRPMGWRVPAAALAAGRPAVPGGPAVPAATVRHPPRAGPSTRDDRHRRRLEDRQLVGASPGIRVGDFWGDLRQPDPFVIEQKPYQEQVALNGRRSSARRPSSTASRR